MKNVKRISAILFALAMIVTMLPIFSITASAAGTLTVSDPGIGLSWTDASSSSGSAGWSASGTTITGTATGYKMLSILSRSITTKLTITNNYSDARTLSFNYSLANGGSVSGISGNAYSGELAAGGSLTITLTSPSGASTCTLTITDIKLVGSGNVTATFLPGENGSYTVDGAAISAETSYTKAGEESSYTVKATANSGYNFFGWYNTVTGSYLSYDASVTLPVGSDATIKPVFVSGNPAHFSVGGVRYYDLTDAVNAAQAGSDKKIVVVKDGTVTGSHTIPSGITLLVPYNDAHSAHGSSPSCTSYDDLLGGNGQIAWVQPTRYRTLTLGADAHITLNGVIEVGGQHASGGGSTGKHGGSPTGPLGFIEMQAGSHIDVNNGATIYAWGYIYGDGTITAKNGAKIYENFQIMDFRGGDKSTELAQGFLVFPTAQYYVQNIEVATKYEYGSTEYVHTSVYMSRMEHGATVQFIGDNAMFRPEPGSYVIKDYDPNTDTLILESYGDCALSELAMSIAGVDVDAGQFVLPITNSMQIHIKSGTATLQQNVMMLPGSSLTVDQGATLNIAYTDATTDVVTAGGYILQMFDYTNYTYGIDMDTFEVVTGRYYNHLDASNGMRSRPVSFTCTTRKTRTEADLVDAKLDINGTVICNGYIYSTVDYADVAGEDYTITGGGANICSSEGTGVIQMVNGAGQDVFGVMYDQNCSTDGTYYYIPLASAQLRNADGTMLDTTYAEAGTTYEYCSEHGCWYTGACDQCDSCAAGHSYEGVQTSAPSCTATGVMTYTCSVCGDSYTEAIEATGHTAGAAADCVNPQTCTVCGTKLADALGHKWNDATCTDPKTCSVCGKTEGDALTHDYAESARIEATCGVAGSITYTCGNCGSSYDEAIEALTHNYAESARVEATCGVAGSITYTCGNCGNSYDEPIEATGKHEYEYDCDKNCAVCGNETRPEAEHEYFNSCETVCMICYEETREASHNVIHVEALDPTCVAAGNIEYWYCDVCGAAWLDAECIQNTNLRAVKLASTGEHSYEYDCDKNCAVCGNETRPEAEHEYFNDCETVCMICYEETREASHNVIHVEALAPTCVAAGNIEYWYCDVCGAAWLDAECLQNTNLRAVKLAATGEHSYDHDFDADCNVCGGERDVVGPVSYIGKSASEDVSGLAFLFNVQADGIVVKEGTFVQADYSGATYNGYKLLGVGAIASNGTSSINIKGERMYDLEEGNAKFAFRVVNIPADKLDVAITMTPYYVVEINGVATTIYGEAQTASYNQAIPAMD